MATPATPPAQLTHGPVGPILWRLALPMVLGVFFLMAVNLVDTYFVGKLGVLPLAAMSFTFPIISIILGITMGLGVGATSAISRAIGSGDDSKVKELTTHALLLALLVVCVVSVLGLLFQRPIFRALGAKEALLPLIEAYMTIWFIGIGFLVIPMVGNGAIRATGDSRSPMLMMLTAAIVNGILDPILIFGLGPVPAMGLQGAAIATLIARAAIFVVGLYLLGVRLKLLTFEIPKVTEVLASWRAILSVGLPASLTNLLAPLAATAVTAMVAQHGSAAIGAYGLGGRIEGLLLIVPMVMGGALSPYIGQNWGAHLPHRVAAGVRTSMLVVVAWGMGAWILVELFAPNIAPLLSKNVEVQAAFVLYLRVLSAGYAVHGIVSVVSASFNATDHAIRSTMLSASQGLLLAVPLATLGDRLFGLGGIFAGLVVAKFLTAALAARWIKTLFTPEDLVLSKMSKETRSTLSALEASFPGMATAFEQFIAEVGHWKDVEVGTARSNTLSFRIKGREIGHLHTDGRLDLPLPHQLRDELVKLGQVEHHGQHYNSCWVTKQIANADDIEEARRILQLNHLLYLGLSQGWDDPTTQQTKDELDLPIPLQQIFKDVVQYINTQKSPELIR